MRWSILLLALNIVFITNANAEPLVLKNDNNYLSLSIYNNLALVKDTRSADLMSGMNEVVFDGVAEKIQPETAIIYAQDVKVVEQNYSYNLMTNNNLIDQSVGQKVKTVRQNPETGENIFETATIIGAIYGQPILEFSYGIESNFPGRIVFEKLPNGVSNKPTLTAKLNNKKSGSKNLNLAYLTNGISWKTDYVADVTCSGRLNLTGWVTIKNESGIDYHNAKIQVVAGDVNTTKTRMKNTFGMLLEAGRGANLAYSDTANISPESVNSYEIYTLPLMTSIADKQTKQIGLIEKNNVIFFKEFDLISPLYFHETKYDAEFKKVHPSITYKINNDKKSNLGISLPEGTIRFYENDKLGNMQFIGASRIDNTAKEDTLEIKLGEAFNISVSGKIKSMNEREISRIPNKECFNVKTVETYNVEMIINNAENNDNDIVISQDFPSDYKIVKESVKGKKINKNRYQWSVKTLANNKNTLTFTVELEKSKRKCGADITNLIVNPF